MERPRLAHPAALLLGLAVLVAACGGEPPPPRHLVLVTVDTLRADRLASYGSSLDLTPHLDRLAREAVNFERAFAPAPFTLPSVAALLTGRHPEALGVESNVTVVPRDVPTLASELFGRGFRTGAVVSSFVLRRAAGLAGGFEHYDDLLPQREARRPVGERVARDTTDAALRMLDELRAGDAARVFLWVHFQDPHGPYTPPPGFRERYLAAERAVPDGARRLPASRHDRALGAIPAYQYIPGWNEVAWYRAGYDGEVRYLDEEIERLLTGIEARGLEDETALVFTADHGEALGEENLWFAHGQHLSHALVWVPLLIRAPGLAPGRRSDAASLVDLFPTLLALMLGEAPPGLPGRDLLAPGAAAAEAPVVLTTLAASEVPRRGLVRGDLKLLEERPGEAWSARLLAVGDDERDLSAEQPERLGALRAELARLADAMQARPSEPQDLAPEDLERLRALGYAE